MLEKAGARKYALPFLAVILIGCVMALVFYPMVSMTPKDLPFAILNLDEGAETPQGTINMGDVALDSITSMASGEDDSDLPITWAVLDSQEELDEALANNRYYGALVIPADFTESNVAAQMAESTDGQNAPAGAAANPEGAEATGAASLHVILDNAKSPLVATMMQTTMAGLFSEAGLEADVEVVHGGASEGNAMSTMMSQQVGIMPLFMMSALGAVLTFLALRPARTSTRSGRWKSVGLQFACAAGVSLVAAITAFCIATGVAGAEMAAADTILFFWLASFCVMVATLGCLNITPALGALALLAMFGLGMCTGIIPFELLPPFWQDWVFPWAPQRFIGEGMRELMFMDAGAWNNGSGPLLVTGVVGAALLCLSGLKAHGLRGRANEHAGETDVH